MQILYGAPVAQHIESDINRLRQQYPWSEDTIGLAIVMVGDNPASELYIKNKTNFANKLGIRSHVIKLDINTSEDELRNTILKLNHDPKIHGILVQAPLPPHLPFDTIIEWIDPRKDVDGFHPLNVGKLTTNRALLQPCTPAGIMRMLQYYNIETQCPTLVIGRSSIVGTPMAIMLSRPGVDATVTLAHSRSPNLSSLVQSATLIISAVGHTIISKDWVQPHATVIDVGTVPLIDAQGKRYWQGDVDPETICKAKSPVPKGVGPITVAMLMYNTVQAFLEQQNS